MEFPTAQMYSGLVVAFINPIHGLLPLSDIFTYVLSFNLLSCKCVFFLYYHKIPNDLLHNEKREPNA